MYVFVFIELMVTTVNFHQKKKDEYCDALHRAG